MSSAPFRVISQAEAEELVDHFQSRPDIWHSSEGEKPLWIRAVDKETKTPCVVVRISNGLPDNFYSVAWRPMQVWSDEKATHYVDWLLDKFTGLRDRKRLEAILQPLVQGDVDLTVLARDVLQALSDGVVKKRRVAAVREATPPTAASAPPKPPHQEGSTEGHTAALKADAAVTPSAPTERPSSVEPQPKMSLYMQRLIGKRPMRKV